MHYIDIKNKVKRRNWFNECNENIWADKLASDVPQSMISRFIDSHLFFSWNALASKDSWVVAWVCIFFGGEFPFI